MDLACPDAADADDNGVLQITDVIKILAYLYLGGEDPLDPGPLSCVYDPTEDDDLGPCAAQCR